MSNGGKSKVAVMFSGGTDSTYASWLQIPNYDQTILVTFTRHGLRRAENPLEAVKRLRQAFPDKKITYKQVNYEDIYEKVTPREEKWEVQRQILSQEISPLWENRHGAVEGQEAYDLNKQRLFMTNECLQCKVAMHIAAIRFCKESGITDLCDGSNTEQLDDGSQIEDVKEIAQDIFKRYGINYFSPVFHVQAEERGRALFEGGITDHAEHKRLDKTHQIPSWQIQCTVPSSVLWTVCIFPWLVYDGKSCNDYIEMCCRYYKEAMENGLRIIDLNP